MSTTPPPSQAPPPRGYDYGTGAGMPQLPALNGEFLFFLLIWAVLAIVTLASDQVGAGQFVTSTVWIAVAYLVSRGIAKAGKVTER